MPIPHEPGRWKRWLVGREDGVVARATRAFIEPPIHAWVWRRAVFERRLDRARTPHGESSVMLGPPPAASSAAAGGSGTRSGSTAAA